MSEARDDGTNDVREPALRHSGEWIEPFEHAITRAYRWPAEHLRDLLDSAGFDALETYVREARGQRPVGAMVCERRRTDH